MAEGDQKKNVHRFEVGESDELATVFAFMHGLNDPDVLVQVQGKQGRDLQGVTITVQDHNTVIVQNPAGFANGDKIVVRA